MEKIALVLSGGGFKGAFQVGALQYIKENWDRLESPNPNMNFDIVAGVSVGSLNGLLVAQNNFSELQKLWDEVGEKGVEEIYTSELIDTTHKPNDPSPELDMKIDWSTIKKLFPNTTKNIVLRALFKRKSIFQNFKKDFSNFRSIADNSPLRAKLYDLAKRDSIQDTIYKCGFVSLDDGRYYSYKSSDFASDKDFAEAVLASSAMPIVWEPVERIQTKNSAHFNNVDGGIRDVSPLGDVIHEIIESDEVELYTIIIINCSCGEVEKDNYSQKNIASIALRSLADIAITEVFNNDLSVFIDKNYIVKEVQKKHPEMIVYDFDYKNKKKGKPLKCFRSIIIQPDANTLGDSLVSSKVLNNKRKTHGYRKAKLAIDEYLTKVQMSATPQYEFTIV